MGRKPPKLKSNSYKRLNRWVNEMSDEEIDKNRLWQQLRTIEYVNQMPVIQFREPNVEADDVISYIKSMPAFSDWQKVIISSDKDFIQLLDQKTLLFRPTQNEVLNTNRIVEAHSIHPNNFALARAMVGDKSDNIAGLSGVGLKTVAKAFPFLSEAGDYLLSDVKEHSISMSESKLKIYDKVLEEYQKVCDNYSIMQLDTPLISVQSASYINTTFEEYDPMFNMTEMRKMLSADGMSSTNLDCLTRRFNSLVEEGVNFS
jgi:5'-3' exonuclease